MAAFAAIAAGHALLVISLWELRSHTRAAGAVPQAERLEIFFVSSPVETPPVVINPRREQRRRALPPAVPAAIEPAKRSPAEPESTAITVDWGAEAQAAAGRSAEADGEAQRRARAFSPREAAPGKRAPEFGWSHSRTHRVERTEDGVPLLWISERCVLVYFLIPGCKLGKIEPNGDLFEHMNDPPELGDWKDP